MDKSERAGGRQPPRGRGREPSTPRESRPAARRPSEYPPPTLGVLLLVTPCSRRESRRHHVQRTRYISSAHRPRARPDRPAAPRQVAPSCSDDTAEDRSDSSPPTQGVAIRGGTGTPCPALPAAHPRPT